MLKLKIMKDKNDLEVFTLFLTKRFSEDIKKKRKRNLHYKNRTPQKTLHVLPFFMKTLTNADLLGTQGVLIDICERDQGAALQSFHSLSLSRRATKSKKDSQPCR